MILRKVDEIGKEELKVGQKTLKQVLISSEDAPNFAMRKFTIEPGGFMPMHTNTVEHEQYVLNGKAKVKIGDKLLTVEKNDVVFIPKGVEHNYTTIGDEAFEFLCIVPNEKDTITLINNIVIISYI